MIPLLEELYKEIEHGDSEHRKWLWDKLDEFSRKKFKEYYCKGHEWEPHPLMTEFYICKHCGYVSDEAYD